MKWGLISDTHDHLVHIRRAMDLFQRQGVERVLHLGDYGSPKSVLAMEGMNVCGVLGNNDGEILGLNRAFASIGGVLMGQVGEFAFFGGKGVSYHGTIPTLRDALIHGGQFDLVALGHTHSPRDEWIGRTRVLNPGTAHGFGGYATVMVYDDTDGEVGLYHL
ncbi:MAG: YfcE family phosphodiesterase [Magnetococcales bacterium]|nr:YfcE family phosphodiesterase [Magnetococcales bacterium]